MDWLMSSQPDNYTPINLDGINNAETPSDVHDATRALLWEAHSLVQWASSHPEVQQSFIGDYNWATDEYTHWYTTQKAVTWGALADLKVVSDWECHRETIIDNFYNTIWEKWLGDKYWILGSAFGLYPIPTSLIKKVTKEISDSEKISLWNLQTLDDFINSEYQDLNDLKNTELIWIIDKWLSTWDFWDIKNDYNIPDEEKVLALRLFLDKNPQYIEVALFEINLKDMLFNTCSANVVIYLELIKEVYLDSKNINIRKNIVNHYKNQNISPEKQVAFNNIINDLEESESFNILIQTLKSWDCTIDNIWEIKKFNEEHFWSLWIELDFSQEDATAILGSVIEARKAENLVEILGATDQIITITGIDPEILTAAMEGENPAVEIGKLLDPLKEKYPELIDLEWQLFEQLDITREIIEQEVRTEAIITQAPVLYDMTAEERAEVKEVLMNTSAEEIEDVLAEKVDEIMQRPENQIATVSEIETWGKYNEIISEMWLTPEEASTLTGEELQAISSSEVVKESFLHFKNTLEEYNLDQLFPFRHYIFRAIGSLDFNLKDGNYIWENELNIFLSKTTYAITWDKDLKVVPSNIDTTLLHIRKLNHIDGFSGKEDVNYVWEGGSRLEITFREKFAPKDDGLLGFKTGSFLRALQA